MLGAEHPTVAISAQQLSAVVVESGTFVRVSAHVKQRVLLGYTHVELYGAIVYGNPTAASVQGQYIRNSTTANVQGASVYGNPTAASVQGQYFGKSNAAVGTITN